MTSREVNQFIRLELSSPARAAKSCNFLSSPKKRNHDNFFSHDGAFCASSLESVDFEEGSKLKKEQKLHSKYAYH